MVIYFGNVLHPETEIGTLVRGTQFYTIMDALCAYKTGKFPKRPYYRINPDAEPVHNWYYLRKHALFDIVTSTVKFNLVYRTAIINLPNEEIYVDYPTDLFIGVDNGEGFNTLGKIYKVVHKMLIQYYSATIQPPIRALMLTQNENTYIFNTGFMCIELSDYAAFIGCLIAKFDYDRIPLLNEGEPTEFIYTEHIVTRDELFPRISSIYDAVNYDELVHLLLLGLAEQNGFAGISERI